MVAKIATLNCQGMADKIKRLKLFEWIRIQNFHIVVLTETNCHTLDQGKIWERESGCKIYWSFASSVGSGVGLLFCQNFKGEIHSFHSHFSGRIISAIIRSNNYIFKLIGVYIPAKSTTYRIDVLQYLEMELRNNLDFIILGDFNFVENFYLDKITTISKSSGQYRAESVFN